MSTRQLFITGLLKTFQTPKGLTLTPSSAQFRLIVTPNSGAHGAQLSSTGRKLQGAWE